LSGENWSLRKEIAVLMSDITRKEKELEEWRREIKAFMDVK
jgi:hypothetical protein